MGRGISSNAARNEKALQTTKMRLDRGAKVIAINLEKDSLCYSRTPLIHNASQCEDCREITQMQLKAGADINIKEANGKMALDIAG